MTNDSFARNKSYFFHLSSNLCPTHFESRLSKNVVKLYNVNKLQILMRKLTHHRRKTSLPAVTRVIFCPAKQRLSGKIRKIHRSGRVYTKATVANEL